MAERECSICIEDESRWELIEDIEICPQFKRRRGLKDWMVVCTSCKFKIVQMYHEETDLVVRLIIARQLRDRSPPSSIGDLLCPFGPGPRVSEGEEPLFF